MHIVIIGAGSFGTALAQTLAQKKENQITIHSIEKDVIESIQKTHINSKYLPECSLNPHISITDDYSVLESAQIIILAIPSSVIPIVCKNIRKYIDKQIIVVASKGISQNGSVLTDSVELMLQIPPSQVVALSGPSIAKELVSLKPTSIVIGGELKTTQFVKEILQTDSLFIKTTTDKRGIQLLGFYKNIISILVGLCDGLELGNNFTATLITKAYSELYYLNQNKYIRRHSFIDYAGLGDLYVTSTSLNSRNRQFGKLLATSTSIQSIQKKIGQVVEGYDNLQVLLTLSQKLKQKELWFDINLIQTIQSICLAKNKVEKKKLLMKYLQSSHIRAIVFDWGNVLTKTYYTRTVAQNISRAFGYEAEKVFIELEKKEKQALLGKDSLKEFLKKIQQSFPKITLTKLKQIYTDSIIWDEKMLKLCRKLNTHYEVYILSNNYPWISPILHEKLKTITKKQWYSNDIKITKPNVLLFQTFLQEQNLRGEHCVFIDDNSKNTKIAEQLHFHTILHTSYEETLEKLKRFINI